MGRWLLVAQECVRRLMRAPLESQSRAGPLAGPLLESQSQGQPTPGCRFGTQADTLRIARSLLETQGEGWKMARAALETQVGIEPIAGGVIESQVDGWLLGDIVLELAADARNICQAIHDVQQSPGLVQIDSWPEPGPTESGHLKSSSLAAFLGHLRPSSGEPASYDLGTSYRLPSYHSYAAANTLAGWLRILARHRP